MFQLVTLEYYFSLLFLLCILTLAYIDTIHVHTTYLDHTKQLVFQIIKIVNKFFILFAFFKRL